MPAQAAQLPRPPPAKARYAPSLGGGLAGKPAAGEPITASGLISAVPSVLPRGGGSGGGSARPRRGLKDVSEDELCCPITQARSLASVINRQSYDAAATAHSA